MHYGRVPRPRLGTSLEFQSRQKARQCWQRTCTKTRSKVVWHVATHRHTYVHVCMYVCIRLRVFVDRMAAVAATDKHATPTPDWAASRLPSIASLPKLTSSCSGESPGHFRHSSPPPPPARAHFQFEQQLPFNLLLLIFLHLAEKYFRYCEKVKEQKQGAWSMGSPKMKTVELNCLKWNVDCKAYGRLFFFFFFWGDIRSICWGPTVKSAWGASSLFFLCARNVISEEILKNRI